MELSKIKNCWEGIFQSTLKKHRILQYLNRWKSLSMFSLHHVFITYTSFSIRYLLGLIQRRRKIHKKNMSRGCALNFDVWQTFSENCKQIRVWSWLVCKITGNNCGSRLFTKFIKIPKRYLTSFDKISILTWTLFVISCKIYLVN